MLQKVVAEVALYFIASDSMYGVYHRISRISLGFRTIIKAMEKTKDQPQTIGTHSGTFHCDEALACFMLKLLPEYENAKIFRSRNINELQKECSILVDVGAKFDHESKLYDHHQRDFQETLSSLRPELGDEYNIRLSSAGLVYTFYGERVIESILKKRNMQISSDDLRLIYKKIYENFIAEIDAIDNGVPICPDGREPVYKITTALSSRVGNLNPSWDTDPANVDCDELFKEAVNLVGKEFVEKVVGFAGSWLLARENVRIALESAPAVYPSGEILLLNKFCPWKLHLCDLEKIHKKEGVPKVILLEDNDGSWRVACVPITPASFLCRKPLPKTWCGLRDETLSQVAGIEDLIFVHNTGFVGGAKTKEAALAMAIKSVQWPATDEN